METFATVVVIMAMIALGVLLIRLANRQHAMGPPPSTEAAAGWSGRRHGTRKGVR
ncbi:hypothetical protein QF030_004222 [Streptomyces rishiriensis]|uniref:Secreted protein n=1 Tax=Streptomyces rishiriensis TaxID=68264 RepID=A0ABU0NSU4_STRRH|nr:hypothetical protein [Streptomyces rishiriensis]